AEDGVNTIFMPYSPSSVGDLQTQIQSSLLSADTITKTTTPANIAKAAMKSKKAKRASDDDPSGYDDLV
ncbi:MAG: hypothetical protein ACPGSL_09960, partial [Vicingaceae bacterium]